MKLITKTRLGWQCVYDLIERWIRFFEIKRQISNFWGYTKTTQTFAKLKHARVATWWQYNENHTADRQALFEILTRLDRENPNSHHVVDCKQERPQVDRIKSNQEHFITNMVIKILNKYTYYTWLYLNIYEK